MEINNLDVPLHAYPTPAEPKLISFTGRNSMSSEHALALAAESETGALNSTTVDSYRGGPIRFVSLTAQAFMMFGSYYFFDQLSGLGVDGLRNSGMKITETQFGALQAVYSFPNIVIPLFGGLLLDKTGMENAILFLFSLILLGQGVFSIGISFKSFPMMLMGQFTFGLGGESLHVASLALVALWFRNREMGSDRVSLKLVKEFDVKFWLVCASCVSVSASAFPFLKVTVIPFLLSHLPDSVLDPAVAAGLIASSVTVVIAVCSPIAGLFIDRVGWRPFWICTSAIGLTIANFIFAWYPKCEHESCENLLAVLVGFMGFPLAVYGAAMWTIVPFVVEDYAVGTGFGLIIAVQNLGMCLAPIILSALHDSDSQSTNFVAPFAFIVVCDLFGFVCGIALWRKDAKEGGRLMLPNLSTGSRTVDESTNLDTENTSSDIL
eukprot:GEMP01038091.1.p1 GENE.GEMP01038091.1~~GEMP01038091.1.p1  ORF type:complete len:436 (+),score=57.75 GEMP01038091.1:165-1472(+)